MSSQNGQYGKKEFGSSEHNQMYPFVQVMLYSLKNSKEIQVNLLGIEKPTKS